MTVAETGYWYILVGAEMLVFYAQSTSQPNGYGEVFIEGASINDHDVLWNIQSQNNKNQNRTETVPSPPLKMNTEAQFGIQTPREPVRFRL